MTKAERIEYEIKKECRKVNLTKWCEDKGFSVDDFEKFLEYGKDVFTVYEVSKEDAVQNEYSYM